jgi:diadenosine tetraphosphate (Ap4A) HIT family hydrolase
VTAFVLHERLAADTLELGDLALCRVLLTNDARYPWVILVPRVAGLRELHHLEREDRVRLQDESCRVAECLERLFRPDKLNVASLGNLVPQYHLHHVARFTDDPAWPGPVWGHGPAVVYDPAVLEERLRAIRAFLRL